MTEKIADPLSMAYHSCKAFLEANCKEIPVKMVSDCNNHIESIQREINADPDKANAIISDRREELQKFAIDWGHDPKKGDELLKLMISPLKELGGLDIDLSIF